MEHPHKYPTVTPLQCRRACAASHSSRHQLVAVASGSSAFKMLEMPGNDEAHAAAAVARIRLVPRSVAAVPQNCELFSPATGKQLAHRRMPVAAPALRHSAQTLQIGLVPASRCTRRLDPRGVDLRRTARVRVRTSGCLSTKFPAALHLPSCQVAAGAIGHAAANFANALQGWQLGWRR